ncbi:PPC domain-containing DNA-binding protein [Flavobacterium selenitireducens]|uniref:PPC domain-containing DNA-binding protein n=1 Tax=Flavobacterium selenitireducens TaxID=2722704 RepID=UPI00168AA753|nr:PPC domain-containing DNA-binding protein [Flavobacterium selenitireducens]MBD3582266.1 DNA-binding protein [Flavobacterium selenitireducens]
MKYLICAIATVFCISAYAQKQYVKVPEGYLMVLEQGDDILSKLEAFAIAEKIPSANFTGMGFVNMKFGFFNYDTKEYEPKQFDDVELAAMQGTIGLQKDKVSIHAHGVVTDRTFQAYGGHILDGKVGKGTLEIMIFVHDKKFERVKDEKRGYNILCLENCPK